MRSRVQIDLGTPGVAKDGNRVKALSSFGHVAMPEGQRDQSRDDDADNSKPGLKHLRERHIHDDGIEAALLERTQRSPLEETTTSGLKG